MKHRALKKMTALLVVILLFAVLAASASAATQPFAVQIKGSHQNMVAAPKKILVPTGTTVNLLNGLSVQVKKLASDADFAADSDYYLKVTDVTGAGFSYPSDKPSSLTLTVPGTYTVYYGTFFMDDASVPVETEVVATGGKDSYQIVVQDPDDPCGKTDVVKVDNLIINSVTDGSAPFNDDNSSGHDSAADNKIVRSFDDVTYELQYQWSLENTAIVTEVDEFFLHVKFTLPVTSDKAEFNLGAMSWLLDPVVTESGGQQILTGRYQKTGVSGASGTGTLAPQIKVKGMANGSTIQPSFEVWSCNNTASQHKTVKADGSNTVKVSAKPSYNVILQQNTNLQHKDGYGSTVGRMYGYNIYLQMTGLPENGGMKGVELPNANQDATLKINLSSTYTTEADPNMANPTGGTGQYKDYAPRFWDYTDEAGDRTGEKGKNMYWGTSTLGSNLAGSDERNGVWSTGSASGATGSITFNVNVADLNTAGTNGKTAVDDGYFGLGYVEFYQPLPKDDDAIEALGGPGSFNIKITDTDFSMSSIGGSTQKDPAGTNDSQTKQNDDESNNQCIVTIGGTYSKNVYVMNEDATAYLSTAEENGDAWTTRDADIGLNGRFYVGLCDEEYEAYAVNNLIKFDANALENIDFNKVSGAAEDHLSYTMLYAAKKDGSNWTSDTEMNDTHEDDLVFYSTLAELQADTATLGANPQCVAVLFEGRGDDEKLEGKTDAQNLKIKPDVLSSNTAMSGYVTAHTKNSAKLGDEWVYQFIQDVRIWRVGTDFAYRLDGWQPLTQVPSRIEMQADGKAQPSTGMKNFYTDPAYVKSTYNGSGWSGGHLFGTKDGNSLILVAVNASITKSTNQAQTGRPKTVYDVTGMQRVVDWQLTPAVTHAGVLPGNVEIYSNVTLVDTLPYGLSYMSGSSVYGGIYTQNGQMHGVVNGGKNIEPVIEMVPDPTDATRKVQKLTWEIGSIKVDSPMEILHFSTIIGDAGNPDNDVINEQRLTNHSEIIATRDGRKISVANGNASDFGIIISKLSQSSIIKYADAKNYELNSDITYIVGYSNEGKSTITGAKLLDILPYNGDSRGSAFSGNYSVVSVSVNKGDINTGVFSGVDAINVVAGQDFNMIAGVSAEDTDGNPLTVSITQVTSAKLDPPYTWDGVATVLHTSTDTKGSYTVTYEARDDEDNLVETYTRLVSLAEDAAQTDMSVWYTTDKTARNHTDVQNVEIDVTHGWTQVTQNADGTYDLPQDAVAIASTGSISANTTFKLNVVIRPTGNQPGDSYGNDVYAFADGLQVGLGTPPVQATIIRRSISGLAWVDANRDGKRDAEEGLITGGIKVVLLDVNGNAAKDVYGNAVANVVTMDGTYKFTNLAPGEYQVMFESNGDVHLSEMTITTQKAMGVEENFNSDAALTSADTSKISGIILPTDTELVDYQVVHMDVGYFFTATGDLTISKTVTGNGAPTDREFTMSVDFSGAGSTGTYSYSGPNGAAGVMQSGWTCTLKDGESVTIFGLPTNMKYEVLEQATDQTAHFSPTPENCLFTGKITTGSLAAGTDVKANFVNEFAQENVFPGTATLSVEKIIAGNTPITKSNFTFTVTPLMADAENDGAILEDTANAMTSTVTGAGTVQFGKQILSEDGIYACKIVEMNGGNDDYQYDDRTCYIVLYAKAVDGQIKLATPVIIQNADAEVAEEALKNAVDPDSFPADDAAFTELNLEIKPEFVNTYLGANPPAPGTGHLIVSKTVTGDLGNQSKEFHFKVEFSNLEDPAPTSFEYLVNGEAKTIANGDTIVLCGGEHVTFINIPANASYTVTEIEAGEDGYKTSSTGAEGDIQNMRIVASAFVNNKQSVPTTSTASKTGDSNSIALYSVLMLAALGAGAVVLKKKKED